LKKGFFFERSTKQNRKESKYKDEHTFSKTKCSAPVIYDRYLRDFEKAFFSVPFYIFDVKKVSG